MNPLLKVQFIKETSDITKKGILEILDAKADQSTITTALEIFSKSMLNIQDVADNISATDFCSGDSTAV